MASVGCAFGQQAYAISDVGSQLPLRYNGAAWTAHPQVTRTHHDRRRVIDESEWRIEGVRPVQEIHRWGGTCACTASSVVGARVRVNRRRYKRSTADSRSRVGSEALKLVVWGKRYAS